MSLYSIVRPAMATEFTLFLYAGSSEEAEQMATPAFEEIDRIEDLLSNYRDGSELSRINIEAPLGEVTTDPETFRFLAAAFEWSARSLGAFDMTVGKLMKSWGFYNAEGSVPSPAELKEARGQVGWEKVQLDRERRTVHFLAPGVELDPGGIGKGYAVDRAIHVLKENGIDIALLSAGSSTVYALGAPRGEPGWRIEVPDPAAADHAVSDLSLCNTSLSTANYSQKHFIEDGRFYGSIMDLRTLRPVEGVLQVSAIAPSALDSDVLSNALFVLGPDEREAIIDSLPGASALIVLDCDPAAPRLQSIRWPAAAAEHENSQSNEKEKTI